MAKGSCWQVSYLLLRFSQRRKASSSGVIPSRCSKLRLNECVALFAPIENALADWFREADLRGVIARLTLTSAGKILKFVGSECLERLPHQVFPDLDFRLELGFERGLAISEAS